MTTLTWILLAAAAGIVQIIIAEVFDWLPWLGKKLVRRATRSLPTEQQDRYEREWLAEMEAIPGRRLSPLIFAINVYLGAGRTGRALGRTSTRRNRVALRAFDVSVAAALLVSLLPVMALIMGAIRLTSRGPIVYKSRRFSARDRVGLYVDRPRRSSRAGRDVYHRRFRTEDATPGHDPSVTRVGWFLRRSGLDELPRLVDVLRGDATFGGPRMVWRVFRAGWTRQDPE